MKETAIYKWWMQTKETLAPMTWRQRVDHIWTYYRTLILIVLIFAFMLGYVAYAKLTSKDVLLGGIHANVELTDTGHSHISTDFFQLQQGNASREEVSILELALAAIKDEESLEMNYYYLQAVHTRVGAQEVDYFLADKVALQIFMAQDMYLDLREFFTQDELAQLEDRLIYLEKQNENDNSVLEERYPVAVDVSGMAFFTEYAKDKEEIYFSVASNSLNKEIVRAFWYYLCGFEKH